MFQNHFSRQADLYRRYRPGYPRELFAWLASIAPACGLALDCATGNGQAAVGLKEWFRYVIAGDGSLEQLTRAARRPGIVYVANLAEHLPVRDACIDLVVAAQAAHWFDLSRFYREARRVLVPGGVIALFTYEKFRVNAAVDALVDRFYTEVVGPYWPPERRHVETGYRELPFPFTAVDAPPFVLSCTWDLAAVMGYIGSWSAVERYRVALEADPLPALAAQLDAHWRAAGGAQELRWPIHLRAGHT